MDSPANRDNVAAEQRVSENQAVNPATPEPVVHWRPPNESMSFGPYFRLNAGNAAMPCRNSWNKSKPTAPRDAIK